MSRTVVIALGIAALAGAGVAIAATVVGKAVDPVSATLAVGSSTQSNLKTCTSGAGTFAAAKLDVTATASSSEAALKGAAQLVLQGSIDKEANAGTFNGTLRIDVASGPDTLASFSGVYANGELHGLLTGRSSFASGGTAVKPPAVHSSDRLMANLSANLNPTTGQLSGIKIGQTDSGGPAVLIKPGSSCKPSSTGDGTTGSHPKKP